MTKQQRHIQTLIDAHARQAVPDDLDLWPVICARITTDQRRAAMVTPAKRPRPTNRPTIPRLRLAGLTLAGLVVIVALTQGLQPKPASAAVITARANQAISDVRTFGLAGFSGQVQGQGRDRHMVDGVERTYTYRFAKEISFQPPGQVRVDECVTVEDKPKQCHLLVSGGDTGWLYFPGSKQASRFRTGGETGISFVAADQRSLVSTPNEEPRVRLLGTETIAGRPTHVLEIAPEAGQATNIASTKVWIDQQYYVELRHETYDRQGQALTAWSYTSFTPNPSLEPSSFSFSPPTGVQVEEGYPLNTNTLYVTPELRFVVEGRAQP